jgi:hypothetical protein
MRYDLRCREEVRTTTVESSRIDSTCTIAHVADTIQETGVRMRGRIEGHFRTRSRGRRMGGMTVASSEAGSCDAAQGDGDSRADREGACVEEEALGCVDRYWR